MATVTIRKLDDAVYERLRAQARANNRSLEAEARRLIIEGVTAKVDVGKVIEKLRSHHAEMRAKYGVFPDSTDLIRRMRDEE